MKRNCNDNLVWKMLGVVLIVADVGVEYGSVVWLRKRHCGLSLIHADTCSFHSEPSMNL